jgi:hypothetical protein
MQKVVLGNGSQRIRRDGPSGEREGRHQCRGHGVLDNTAGGAGYTMYYISNPQILIRRLS